MPIVFGESVSRVEDIVRAFALHGDRIRGVYRARYVFDEHSRDPYAGTALERPDSLVGNPPGTVYPWEQVFLAAAACAGSDYPMLAAFLRVPLERVELVVEGLFDPRHEFDGLAGFAAPPGSEHCFLTLHLRATLASPASWPALEEIHARVLRHNMVLGALRGIPTTSELRVVRPEASRTGPASGGRDGGGAPR